LEVELYLFVILDGEVADVWFANLCPATFFGEISTLLLGANRLLMTRSLSLTSKF